MGGPKGNFNRLLKDVGGWGGRVRVGDRRPLLGVSPGTPLSARGASGQAAQGTGPVNTALVWVSRGMMAPEVTL